MKYLIVLLFGLLQLADAKSQRILILWDVDNIPLSQMEQEMIWSRALQKEFEFLHPDTSARFLTKIEDSLFRDPSALPRIANRDLKLDGVLKLHITTPNWQSKRFKWFPLISKENQSQSLSYQWFPSKGNNKSNALQMTTSRWGTWCGFHPCPAPNFELREQRGLELEQSIQLIEKCLSELK